MEVDTFEHLGETVDNIITSAKQNNDPEIVESAIKTQEKLYDEGINRVQGSMATNPDKITSEKFEFENFSMEV